MGELLGLFFWCNNTYCMASAVQMWLHKQVLLFFFGSVAPQFRISTFPDIFLFVSVPDNRTHPGLRCHYFHFVLLLVFPSYIR